MHEVSCRALSGFRGFCFVSVKVSDRSGMVEVSVAGFQMEPESLARIMGQESHRDKSGPKVFRVVLTASWLRQHHL